MVGWDTPEPIRLWRLCRTRLFAGRRSLKQESPFFRCGERQDDFYIVSVDEAKEQLEAAKTIVALIEEYLHSLDQSEK